MVNPKEELLNTFLLCFGGQFVQVTTTLNVTMINNHNTESIPVCFTGILLDIDEDYLYLGESINEITSAIKKTEVVHIILKDETTELDDLLATTTGGMN
jgi:hypothetical protein